MNGSRRQTLIAGLAIIGLTNAAALGGAVYNRIGEPDSTLILTQRELRLPYVWTGRKENSGLTLRLQWRVLASDDRTMGPNPMVADNSGSPGWLDEGKMASLGFDVSLSAASPEVGRVAPYQRQLPRDVLVVLELDGPAYREALERAAKAAKEAEGKNERGQGKKLADDMMIRETRLNSRLFAVDVGLDRATLRDKFPDRAKYAIVHGQVRPAWLPGSKVRAGFIDNLSATEINVALELRSVFQDVAPVPYAGPNVSDKQFEARVAFGKRLEPWLIGAAVR